MGIFKRFTENSFMHINAFNLRTYKPPFIPCYFTLCALFYFSFWFV